MPSTSVAAGGAGAVNKFGANPSAGTGLETLWGPGGLLAYLPSPSTVTVSSDDAGDTNGGAGAWNCVITGLDSDGLPVSQQLNLAGTTPVATTVVFSRIFRMQVLQAGLDAVSGLNIGTIYAGTGAVTGGVPAVIYGTIEPEANQSLMGFYTVPANRTATLHMFYASTGAGRDGIIYLYSRAPGEAFKLKDYIELSATYARHEHHVARLKFPPLTDIELRCRGGATGTRMSGGFDLTLNSD
jgi:hypothetical protein